MARVFCCPMVLVLLILVWLVGSIHIVAVGSGLQIGRIRPYKPITATFYHNLTTTITIEFSRLRIHSRTPPSYDFALAISMPNLNLNRILLCTAWWYGSWDCKKHAIALSAWSGTVNAIAIIVPRVSESVVVVVPPWGTPGVLCKVKKREKRKRNP